MRLVPRPVRDVKLHRLALDLRLHLQPRCSQISIGVACLPRLQRRGYGASTQPNVEPTFSIDAITDVPSSPVILERAEPPKPSPPPQPQNLGPGASLTQDNVLFGKWRGLLEKSALLAIESDFAREGPAKGLRRPLLVDRIEHRGDLALWSCLLDYQTRANGELGAWNVWRALWGRKSLYDVESPLAPVFWRTLLEAALRSGNEKFLQNIYVYSEWMYGTYGVKWPHLYSTIMTHFLKTHQHEPALRWHMQLMPTFYPGPDAFVELLKRFAVEPKLYPRFTLQSLYIMTPERQLYDKLVPYLYARGESSPAMTWRELLIRRDDTPLFPAPVRPFLRYLKGYFPRHTLHPQEAAAISQDAKLAESEEPPPPEVSRELMNLVHGGTFGITVKNYNDDLGAKWFASSWVSLDMAISAVAALGVKEIGPLSLQSIALREENSEGVAKRLEQLQNHGITVATSNYLRVLLHFIKVKDEELLQDLLQCDLHPDVFDDLPMLAQLLETTADDWAMYRLLLTSRIIILQKTTQEMANAVLRACYDNRDRRALFRALDDMQLMKIRIDSELAERIFAGLRHDVPVVDLVTYDSAGIATFYLHTCVRLVSMEIPVPVANWRQILTSLGRQGRLNDIEWLCRELVTLYTLSRSSPTGFIPVHLDDIPEAMKQPLTGVENLLGIYVPRDLPRTVRTHPLRQIFDQNMIKSLVRWTFRATLGSNPGLVRHVALLGPHRTDFHWGRVVRLVATLRDRGLVIHKKDVVRAVMHRLVDLYGVDVLTKAEVHRAKVNNILSLAEMKSLLDQAWSGTGTGPDDHLLPPLDELRRAIAKQGRAKTQKNLEFLQARGKHIWELPTRM